MPLDNFGFGLIRKSFNPFKDFYEPRLAQPVVEDVASKEVDPVAEEVAPVAEEVVPVVEVPVAKMAKEFMIRTPEAVSTEIIPMIQPRDNDGARLLYKHPNLPKVGVRGEFWLLVGQSDKSSTAWLMQFDGAANPNPGPSSSGAVLWSPKDVNGKRRAVFEMGKYLGKATNNLAEAQGLLLGLKIAAMRGARELLIEGDSELIIFQHTRRYKVSDPKIKVWWSEVQAAMMDETSFDWIAIRQVPREQNERADSITKEVLARKEGFQR